MNKKDIVKGKMIHDIFNDKYYFVPNDKTLPCFVINPMITKLRNELPYDILKYLGDIK